MRIANGVLALTALGIGLFSIACSGSVSTAQPTPEPSNATVRAPAPREPTATLVPRQEEPLPTAPVSTAPPTPLSTTPPATPVPVTPVPTIIATSTPRPNPTPVPPTIPSTATPVPTKVPLEYGIREKLVLYVPRINECDKDDQHRRVIDAAVVQIRDDIYNNNLAVDEKLAWEYINKATGFVVPQLCTIDVSNYSMNDLRQILLPPQLRLVDIRRVLAERGINYVPEGLVVGLKNVTPDSTLGGKSPQEWLGDEAMRDYSNKQSKGYEEALYYALFGSDWPNSRQSAQKVKTEMLSKGEDLPLFVMGWSDYKVGEQRAPNFAPLVGRSLRPKPLAAYFTVANYPGGTAKHTEPWVKSSDGKLIGFWMDKDAFLRDYDRSTWPNYNGELNKPNIKLLGPDRKVYDPYSFR